MQVLIIGFDEPETRALSQIFRADGHAVLGAQGRHGARTFIHAVTPELVVIPEGDRGQAARGWLADLSLSLDFLEAPASEAALSALRRHLGLEPPPPPEAPEAPEAEVVEPEILPSVTPRRLPEPRPPQRDPPEIPREGALPAPGRRRPLPAEASAPAPASAGEDAPAALHPDLASKLAQVRVGDYFSILEVEPNASTWAIREAFERLGRRLSARGWPHRLHPEELEAIDEIGRGLADAFMVLGDEGLRMRYQRALAAAAQGFEPDRQAR